MAQASDPGQHRQDIYQMQVNRAISLARNFDSGFEDQVSVASSHTIVTYIVVHGQSRATSITWAYCGVVDGVVAYPG